MKTSPEFEAWWEKNSHGYHPNHLEVAKLAAWHGWISALSKVQGILERIEQTERELQSFKREAGLYDYAKGM